MAADLAYYDALRKRLTNVERKPFSDPIYSPSGNYAFIVGLSRRVAELEQRG